MFLKVSGQNQWPKLIFDWFLMVLCLVDVLVNWTLQAFGHLDTPAVWRFLLFESLFRYPFRIPLLIPHFEFPFPNSLILLWFLFRLQTTISDFLPATTSNYRQSVSLPMQIPMLSNQNTQFKWFLPFLSANNNFRLSDKPNTNSNALFFSSCSNGLLFSSMQIPMLSDQTPAEMVCYSHLFDFFNADIIKPLSFEFPLWILVLNPPFEFPFQSPFRIPLLNPPFEFPFPNSIFLFWFLFRPTTGNYLQLPAITGSFWIPPSNSPFDSPFWIPLSEFPNSSLISLSSANNNFKNFYRQLPANWFAQCKYQCCQTKHQLKWFLIFVRLHTHNFRLSTCKYQCCQWDGLLFSSLWLF